MKTFFYCNAANIMKLPVRSNYFPAEHNEKTCVKKLVRASMDKINDSVGHKLGHRAPVAHTRKKRQRSVELNSFRDTVALKTLLTLKSCAGGILSTRVCEKWS